MASCQLPTREESSLDSDAASSGNSNNNNDDLPNWKGATYYSTSMMTKDGVSMADTELNVETFMSLDATQQLMARSKVYVELYNHIIHSIHHDGDRMHLYSLHRMGEQRTGGYYVERLGVDAKREMCRTFARDDPQMTFLGSGMIMMYMAIVEEEDEQGQEEEEQKKKSKTVNCFVPVFLGDFEEENMLIRFFWYGGEGPPPERMVTMNGGRPPAPFSKKGGREFNRLVLLSPSSSSNLKKGDAFFSSSRARKRSEGEENHLMCVIENHVDIHTMQRTTHMSPMCQFVLSIGTCVHLSLRCWHCKRLVCGRSKCGRCRAAYFCNAECLREAWPSHRATCRRGGDNHNNVE